MPRTASSSTPTPAATAAATAVRPLGRSEMRLVQAEHVEMILDQKIANGERLSLDRGKHAVDLRFFNDASFCPPTTACWWFDQAKNTAYIAVGEQIASGLKDPAGNLANYALAFHQHEAGHDAFTTRDLAGANALAAREGVSPRALNLGEDARIEHLVRNTWGTVFGWSTFEPRPPMDASQPYSVLNSFIWHEGDRAAVGAHAASEKVPTALVDQVGGFYDRIVKASSTEAVIPILAEFQKLLPPPPSPAAAGAGGSGGAGTGGPAFDWSADPRMEDVTAAQILGGSPAKAAAALASSVSAADLDAKPTPGGAGHHGPDPDLQHVPDLAVKPFVPLPSACSLSDRQHWEEISRSPRIMALAQAILPAFAGKRGRIYGELPTKRFDAGRYIADREDCWVDESRQGPQRPNRILLLHDCSGSMSGKPAQGGRDLVFVLNELARRGTIEGHVVYHKGSCDAGLHQQAFKLPVPAVSVGKVDTNGNYEGIEPTLDHVDQLARKADLVALYTDADISDLPINKPKLHGKGIWTYGVYAGSPDATADLRRHTDYVVRGDSIDETIRLFGAEIQRRGLTRRR